MMVARPPDATCRSDVAWRIRSTCVTKRVRAFDSGETRALPGPRSTRFRSELAPLAISPRLSSRAIRSGPPAAGTATALCADSVTPAPISVIDAAAVANAWTERSCLPIIGSTSNGARKKEPDEWAAETKSRLAARISTRPSPRRTSAADSEPWAPSRRVIPAWAFDRAVRRLVAAAATQQRTKATSSSTTSRLRPPDLRRRVLCRLTFESPGSSS